MTNGHRVGSPDNIWTRNSETRNSGIAWSGSNQSSEGQLDGRSKVSCAISLACPFLFPQRREALISSSVYIRIDVRNVFQSHLDLSKLLEISWKMGNYQKKIPQSDVWFHFPIWFKVGTRDTNNKTHLGLLLAHVHVLLIARPHPIKEEGPTLLYSRSIHTYVHWWWQPWNAIVQSILLCDLTLSRLYFCVCNPLDNIRVAEWLIEKEKLRRR